MLKKQLLEIWKDIKVHRTLAFVLFVIPFWLVLIFYIPRLMLTFEQHQNLDYKEIGPFGDFIGGTTAPWIGTLSVILTFAAFYVQYRANQQQKEDLADQRENWERERFDARYFELVRLHKENVNEMEMKGKVDTLKGKQCFSEFWIEHHVIFHTVYEKWIESSDKTDELAIRCARLSYLMFYYGIGSPNNRFYLYNLNSDEIKVLNKVTAELISLKDDYDENRECEHYIGSKLFKFKCKPFDGHSALLDSYFRHLFQTTKYVDSFLYIKEHEVKYSLMTILRDQLTDFEQLLLLCNSIAWPSDHWDNLFVKYRFIKNMPIYILPKNYVNPVGKYLEGVSCVFLEKKLKVFEVQRNIHNYVVAWAKHNPEKFKKLKIHPEHGEVFKNILD